MQKLTTRFFLFAISCYLLFTVICPIFGIDIYSPVYLLIIEYYFYLLVKNQGRFHCKWAKYLALNIFLVDVITFIDIQFNVFSNELLGLCFILTMWCIAIIVTIVKGIQHYKRLKKIKYERYKTKKTN